MVGHGHGFRSRMGAVVGLATLLLLLRPSAARTRTRTRWPVPPALALTAAAPALEPAANDSCRPWDITDDDDAGCGRWFPRFHPKNALPLAHNNDANAPFFYNGVHHLFMQATFPGVPGWNVRHPLAAPQRAQRHARVTPPQKTIHATSRRADIVVR